MPDIIKDVHSEGFWDNLKPRSPGDIDRIAASVGYEGDFYMGNYVRNLCGVRPALRIKET